MNIVFNSLEFKIKTNNIKYKKVYNIIVNTKENHIYCIGLKFGLPVDREGPALCNECSSWKNIPPMKIG